MARATADVPEKTPAPRGTDTENGAGLRQEPVQRTNVKLRVHPDSVERAKYWSSRHGESYNEYIVNALEQRIARENGDYDLPVLEQQRLNQLVDQIAGLTTTVNNLQIIVNAGFSSVLGLARGDSYLTDAEDGELPPGATGGVLFAGSGFDVAVTAFDEADEEEVA